MPPRGWRFNISNPPAAGRESAAHSAPKPEGVPDVRRLGRPAAVGGVRAAPAGGKPNLADSDGAISLLGIFTLLKLVEPVD
jgi:hypothetical protein